MKVIPDLSKGIFTRTVYKDGDIVRTPKPSLTSWAGDDGWWIHYGEGTRIKEGDKINLITQNGQSNYVRLIYHADQPTPSDILFRVKLKGTGITGDSWYGNYGLRLNVEFKDGLLPADETFTLDLPVGTWEEQQFELRYTGKRPVGWAYCNINANNNSGELEAQDAELIELDRADKSPYGEWKSETIDLYRLQNKPMIHHNLELDLVAFHYDSLDNIDSMYKKQHTIEKFSKFDYVVTRTPYELGDRSDDIALDLAKVTNVFGYVHIGMYQDNSETIPFMTDEELINHIDSCQSYGYYGVFFDMSGYDYNVTRERYNYWTKYCHDRGLKVFANSWIPKDNLDNTIHPTMNPNGLPTEMGEGDFVLLESFYARSDNKYMDAFGDGYLFDMIAKYQETISLAKPLGVKVMVLTYKNQNKPENESLDRRNSYMLAALLGVNGWSFGDTTYSVERPNLHLGSIVNNDMRMVEKYKWESTTDKGVIWASMNGTKQESGSFSTSHSLKNIFFPPVPINADYKWITSNDKITWNELNDTPKRYVRVEAIFRDYLR